MNAFTAKEYTCYYARVLDRDLPLAIDVISDMVTSSVIAKADVDGERDVILEEIAMHEDDPTDAVHDQFTAAVLGDSPLGRPILGTVASIKGLTRTAIAGYYRRRYTAQNTVVTVAGNVAHRDVVRMVKKAFTAAGALGDESLVPALPRIGDKRVRAPGGLSLRHPADRAGQRRARRARGLPHRPASLRPRRAEQRARRRDELAAVPGGPREAGPGVLRLQLLLALRRPRPVRRLRRLPAEEGRPGPGDLPGRGRPRRGRGHHRGGAGPGDRAAARVLRAGSRGLGLADEPARQGGARLRRAARRRRGHRPDQRRDDGRCARGRGGGPDRDPDPRGHRAVRAGPGLRRALAS